MFQTFALHFLISACRVVFHRSHEPRIRVQFSEIRAISLADVFWLVFFMKMVFNVWCFLQKLIFWVCGTAEHSNSLEIKMPFNNNFLKSSIPQTDHTWVITDDFKSYFNGGESFTSVIYQKSLISYYLNLVSLNSFFPFPLDTLIW